MFRFEKYEDSLEEQWDKFITEKSINGTFLQSRRFFNYHPAGRFKDVSLVVYNEKNNIAALIPACELEQDGKRYRPFYFRRGVFLFILIYRFTSFRLLTIFYIKTSFLDTSTTECTTNNGSIHTGNISFAIA